MKSYKIILILLISFVTFRFCFAQEETEAILLDEIGRTSCADMQTRVSVSLNEALKELNSSAYVIIYGKKNDLFEKLLYESWLKGVIGVEEDNNRIRVIRGEERDMLTVQVWKAPINSRLETFNQVEWSYLFPKTIKPFVFTRDLPESGICPSTSRIKLFADLLKANPNARGHLVIHDKTSRNFHIKEKEVLNKLVNQYKVPRNQLKLFYVENKEHPYDFSYTEYWLIPKSKNN